MNLKPSAAVRARLRDEPAASDYEPVLVRVIEIGEPLPAVLPPSVTSDQRYERAMLFVRLHCRPLGVCEMRLQRTGVQAADCAYEIWRTLHAEICAHMRQDGLPEPLSLEAAGLRPAERPRCLRTRDAALAGAPLVSIIVATHDRPVGLASCLRSLLGLDYPSFEVVVVDNAPSSSATVDFMQATYGNVPKVRYVREDRPGLAWARNRGLREARGGIVAFTDDDVLVDRHWLAELVAGFSAGENVACVTGAVFPMELETQSQMWFEQYGGFGKGYGSRVYHAADRTQDRLFPYAAGRFGTGANMAFRTSALRAIGAFDPALGIGSPTKGGEDLAAFFQIIMAGYSLAYEPGAIVHHQHRRDYAGLRKQMYGYGVGLTAHLTKCVVDRPGLLLDLSSRIPGGVAYALGSRSQKNAGKTPGFPKDLTSVERRGMLVGPIAYLWSRWQVRKLVHLPEPAAGYGDVTAPALRAVPKSEELIEA